MAIDPVASSPASAPQITAFQTTSEPTVRDKAALHAAQIKSQEQPNHIKASNRAEIMALQVLEQEARDKAATLAAQTKNSAQTATPATPYRATVTAAQSWMGHPWSTREQADALYGPGNDQYSTAEIKSAIQGILTEYADKPEMAATRILREAVAHKINAKQIVDTGLFTQKEVDAFLSSKGITPAGTTKELSIKLEKAQSTFVDAEKKASDLFETAYGLALQVSEARKTHAPDLKTIEEAFNSAYAAYKEAAQHWASAASTVDALTYSLERQPPFREIEVRTQITSNLMTLVSRRFA